MSNLTPDDFNVTPRGRVSTALIEEIFRLGKEAETLTGIGLATSLASLQGIEHDIMKLSVIRDDLFDIVYKAREEKRDERLHWFIPLGVILFILLLLTMAIFLSPPPRP